MALDQFMNEFSPEVRSRGSAYHRGGAVRILAHSVDVIRAAVKGTQSYGVKFQRTNKGVLLLSCTCPYFLDRGPCKHLWATALTAADQGILAKMPLPTKIELDFEEEDRGGQDQHASMPGDIDLSRPPGIPKKLAALLARNHSAIEPKSPAGWEWLLDQSSGRVGHEPVATGTVMRELLYVADAQATKASGELTLKIVERPRRKDGTWGKEKSARVPIADLPRLSDERDREILPLLQAAGKVEHGYDYYAYTQPAFPSEVRVPIGMAAMLMPRISATGRLYVRAGVDEIKPATYDGERAWELALVVERHADQPFTEVVGRLVRGDQSVDLAAPLVLTRSGWIVFADRLSRFEHFHAFGLVVTLREHERIGLAPIPWTLCLSGQRTIALVGFYFIRGPVAITRMQPFLVVVALDESQQLRLGVRQVAPG